MASTKQIFKKIGRIFLYVFLGILSLVLLLLIFINLPVGKRMVRNQVESYLSKKLKTKVEIGAVDYSLPKWLKIENVYIEDQQKDTLIFGEELRVDLNMIKLIRGNTDIKKVFFKNILMNVNRAEKDSFYNYQFILDAFTGNKSSTPNTDTSEMKLTLDRLIFDNVGLKFSDKFGGNEFSARIKDLDVTMNRFSPDRVRFLVNEFNAKGVDFLMTTYKEPLPTSEGAKQDTTNKAAYMLFLTANKVDLRDVNVMMDNKISGLYYANKVSHLGASNLYFSLGENKGTADALLLDSSAIVFSAPKTVLDSNKKSLEKDTVSAGKIPWVFEAKELHVGTTQIKYDDNNKKPVEGLDFSHLDLTNLNAGISLFKFSADTTRANISQFAFADKSGFKLDTTQLKFIMTDTLIAANDVYIKTPNSVIQRSFQLTFDSLAAIQTAPQNSFIAAMLTNSRIAFNDIYMLVPALKTSLPPAQFANQYIDINTELRGNLARLYLPYFQLSGLSGSRISARGTLYNLTDPKKFAYDLYIDQSNFLKTDILKFVPPANQAQFAKLPPVFNLQGHFTGTTNDLTADLNTNAADFGLNGKFTVKNISDPNKLQFDAQIRQLSLDKNLITGFLPPEALAQLNLPQKINATGTLSGNTNNITTDLKAVTNYGTVAIKGYIKNIRDTKNAQYDLAIITPGFKVGTLIKQDSVLGSVAGNFSAKGTGFDYKTMRSSIKANVAGLDFKKYTYKNAVLEADLNNGFINSTGNISDSAISLNYTLSADVRNKYPTAEGVINIDTVQLKKLNLYDDTLNFSGRLTIDSKSLQPRSLNASAILDSAWIQLGKDPYRLDSVSLIATSANGIDSIKVWSPMAELTAGGAFDYDKIGTSITRYINQYYAFPGLKDTLGNIADQQIAFNGVIKKSPIITGLVPGLVKYDNIDFSGSYASADTDSALNFRANIPMVQYQANRIAAGQINIGSKNEKINYEIKFDTLTLPAKTLYGTYVRGAAAHDSISLNARTKDEKNVDWFGISGDAFVRDETYTFRMKDSLLLNYEPWNVANDNYISYSKEGIIINNFLLTSDTSRISIKSRELVANSPIDIDITKFNLKSISALASSGDTLFAAGILDVKASVSDLDKTLPAFTGNASINDLQIMQHSLGNVTAFAEKQSENNIVANMALQGNGNDVTAKGNYYLNNEQQQFDAELAINKLNFQTIEAFSGGALRNSSGNIHGNITANGKFSDPRWKGEVAFDTTKFTVSQFGTPYNINNQKITFDYPKVSFPDFTITDSLDHKLRVNGFVGVKSMSEFDLGVDINANDFILINAKKAVNSQFYGFASVDANVSITGTSTAPEIEGDVYLNDKSDVYIVLPEKSYAKDEGRSIVRFIDRDTFDINPPVMPFEEAAEEENTFGKFLNYNLNIEVTKEAALTIIVDPVTADEIRVQGDAQLNAGVDPGGNLVLAGTYELDKGYYNLHYQFLQRKFDLEKGSTITFAGEPMDAQVNLKAAYQLETTAQELLASELTDANSIGTAINQKLPFKVVLTLTGALSKPTINFDVQYAGDNNTLVNSELQTAIENKLTQLRGDEAATNKQVFSLLLFGRFVGEQSSDFFKGNGTNFSDIARQSVSQFLSSALNQIAGDLFKGINIDLNLNSYNDYTTGGSEQRTDLNVAVSKNFLNNRLTVTVGKNFGVEGQSAAEKAGNQGGNGFSPDIQLSYKLTADGKYLVRAYTKNQFEVTVDGYVVENGVAFILTMDYDKFNELFRKKKRTKTKK